MEEELLRKMAMEHFLKGKSSASIYGDLGRSRQWFYKWLHRYQSGEEDWFRDESRAPHHPHKTSEDTQKLVTNIRIQLEEHPFAQIGVSAIQWELRKLGLPPPPDWTINRILKREGLVKKNSLRPQGGGISLFPRPVGHQQHPPSRPSRPPLYQGRRTFLFPSYDRPLQPSRLYPPPAPQRRRFGGHGVDALLENDGPPRFSPTRQRTLFPGEQPLPSLLRHRPSTLFIPGDRSGFHSDRRTLAQWNRGKLQ
jgi:hypothetical protein